MGKPLAIFDIDGTLIDSRAIINTAMQRGFAAAGLEAPDYSETRKIVGLSLDVAIDRLAPRHVGPDKLAQIVEGYKEAFVQLRKDRKGPEPAYAGAMELVSELFSRGWSLGIATGKSRRGLDAVLDSHKLRPLFTAHYCADDGPGKPHPFMVQANLDSLDYAPERAVIIGDTSFDMSMGKAAGVSAFGVDWGFHTPEEVLGGGADLLATTMDDLRAALFNFEKALS